MGIFQKECACITLHKRMGGQGWPQDIFANVSSCSELELCLQQLKPSACRYIHTIITAGKQKVKDFCQSGFVLYCSWQGFCAQITCSCQLNRFHYVPSCWTWFGGRRLFVVSNKIPPPTIRILGLLWPSYLRSSISWGDISIDIPGVQTQFSDRHAST